MLVWAQGLWLKFFHTVTVWQVVPLLSFLSLYLLYAHFILFIYFLFMLYFIVVSCDLGFVFGIMFFLIYVLLIFKWVFFGRRTQWMLVRWV